MILDFASHELNDWNEAFLSLDSAPVVLAEKRLPVKEESVRLVNDKLVMPSLAGKVKRFRLLEHLEKSLTQTSAALICGRAGAGKTTFAADFARHSKHAVAWYSVESADGDWKIFLNYLIGSLSEHNFELRGENLSDFVAGLNGATVEQTTEAIVGWLAAAAAGKPLLIVLDDIHQIFDADWFEEFFKSFVMSSSNEVQMLLLTRSQPPVPLWRMRSKQMLSVVDEDLLNFTKEEAVRLFKTYGLSREAAEIAHNDSYGRAAKLRQYAENCKKLNL